MHRVYQKEYKEVRGKLGVATEVLESEVMSHRKLRQHCCQVATSNPVETEE